LPGDFLFGGEGLCDGRWIWGKIPYWSGLNPRKPGPCGGWVRMVVHDKTHKGGTVTVGQNWFAKLNTPEEFARRKRHLDAFGLLDWGDGVRPRNLCWGNFGAGSRVLMG